MPNIILISLDSGKYDYFKLQINDSLKILHNAVFDLISKHNACPVTRENFFEMTEGASTIERVNNFKTNNAYEKYHPHITIGISVIKTPLKFPIIFKPKSVGLFHLEIHATCKQLFDSFDLQ